ncbi:MAG: NUDIX hydrolase [Ruminococcaceae bacterium]|nr:NUDIX hydrolase [Oscillospiraceae bacterium]
MEMKEHQVSRQTVYEGKIICVHRDNILTADGNPALREIVEHHGGVCCAALNDRGELAFVSQYRYAYDKVVMELPAGKLERGEEPFAAIQRELQEETGAVGTDWQDLGELYPTPGYCTEIIHLYSCRVKSIGETHFDEDENLEIRFIPLEEAVRMVMAGELPDSKTQALVMRVWFAEQQKRK